jgi:hypothetical protein
MDQALAVFSSGNITNVLVTSITKLLEMGDRLVLNEASIPQIDAIANGACALASRSRH